MNQEPEPAPEDQKAAAPEQAAAAPPQEPALVPATPEQIEAAENLIRQANLAKIRGESQKAARLLQDAAAAAPTSPAVLELVGDGLMEKKDYKGAVSAYANALLALPGSVNLERKHAEAILARQYATDPFLIQANDVSTYAKGRSAILISIFLPGVGHMAAGRFAEGLGFLIASVLALVGVLTLQGVQAFLSLFGNTQHMSPSGLMSIFALLGVYLWCQFSIAGAARKMEAPRIEHPKPPVDKEF